MDCNDLWQIVSDELESLRGRVRERTAAACSSSETATLAVGALLNQILAEAKAQVDDLGALSALLSDGEGASGIANEASRDMRAFLSTVSTRLTDQVGALHRATEAMQNILRVGARIDEIATASRFLALNAVVESSRLGTAGASSRVIAQEMKELSQSVETANAQISELARELATTLPQVAETATALDGEVSSFRARFDDRLLALDRAFVDLRVRAQDTAQRSSARLDTIVASSHEALSQLQFQDPMAQGLRKIEGLVSDAKHRLENSAMGRNDDTVESSAPVLNAGELALF